MSTSNAKYVGVDGCKAGWISIGLDDCGSNETKVFEEFSELLDYYQEACLILVDIPIGLPCPGPEPRDCDSRARNKLGRSRGSSVFRVPTREVAHMVSEGASRKEADKRSRDLNSKGIGAQAFNIMYKIAEVDEALVTRDKSAYPRVRESHPEICFWSLNEHQSMRENKKTPGGMTERQNVLQRFEPLTEEIFCSAKANYQRMDVARDDVLDALVTAVTAKLAHQDGYNLRTLPTKPPKDSKSLPMEMVYVESGRGRL